MAQGVPSQIGPFAILEELGRGGMGVVHRARRAGADADVALKVLPASEDASEEQVARFQREARIAAQLDHPGIVRCLEWGEADGVAWFAMELVEGEPLSSRLREHEFTWQEAVTLIRDVADALAVAHAQGVLHRDIKPSNILIDAEGKPHLTDFGLAKDTRTESKLTRTGATMGTPAYMSPEQARGEISTLTPASDVRSLGAVLYEVLAGRPAFTGDTPAAVIGNVIQGTPEPAPGLPPTVRDLIASSLANRPADRPRDAAALRTACERVLAGRRPGVRARRRRAASAAVAVVAAVAAVAGGLWLSRPAPPPPEPPAEASGPSAQERAAMRLVRDQPVRARELLDAALASGTLTPKAMLACGLLHWSSGNGPRAREVWGEVPRDTPEFAWACYYRAQEAFLRRAHELVLDTDPAADDVAAMPRAPSVPRDLTHAMTLIPFGKWDEARNLLTKIEGWEADTLRGLIERHDPDGDPLRALHAFEQAATKMPALYILWYEMSGALKDLGRHTESLEAMNTVVRLAPETALGFAARSTIHARLRQYDRSLADAEEAVRLDPRSRQARLALGAALYNLRRDAQALATLDAVVADYPDDVTVRVSRAQLRGKLGHAEGALADLTHALQLAPDDFEVVQGHARVLRNLGRRAEALPSIQALTRARPGDPRAWQLLADTLKESGREIEAKEAFRRAVAAPATNAETFEARGRARMAAREWAGAAEDFRELAGLLPKYVAARHWLIECLERLGQHAEARSELEQALKRWPNTPSLWLRRAHMHWDAGRWAEALADATKAANPGDTPERIPNADPDQTTSVIHYTLGYCRDKLGQDGREDYRRGLQHLHDVLARRSDRSRRELGNLHGDRCKLTTALVQAELRHGTAVAQALQPLDALMKLDGLAGGRLPEVRSAAADTVVRFARQRKPDAERCITMMEQAIGLLGEAIRDDPNLAAAREARGMAYLDLVELRRTTGRVESSDLDGAEADLKRLTELTPNDSASWFQLGIARFVRAEIMTLAKQEDPGLYLKASRAFLQATKLAPNDATFRSYYAQMLAQGGEPAAAVREFEAALKLAPNNQQIRRQLEYTKRVAAQHAGKRGGK